MTGSAAMLAETFHSLADTGNQILLFVGMRLSRRPPDRAHPFGYGMNMYFWAFGPPVAPGSRREARWTPRWRPP